jgi:eukaryotic-like serine/threonine-protein kinase
MSSTSATPLIADFCTTAERLGYLGPADAARLRDELQTTAAPPSQLAIQLGLLDAVQIDTVETLLRPREAVPGYEVLDVLGRGGMGVVYRARQASLGRIVALKTLLVSRMADESFLSRFQQEARTLAQLRHPNIVSIYDFGRAAGRVFIAMEFIDGTDVEVLVKEQGGLPEHVAWGIARQVAAGLAHGDRLGIVHRDIKPANLLLVDPPEGFPLPPGVPMVKIADFGLATLTEESELRTRLTTENATVGSPQYMAPEQFQASRVDRRADIYSLGATVYQLLAGRPPFAGLQLSQIIGFKLSKGPPSLDTLRPDVSRATQALVERMMARDPAARPGDYTELLRAIDDVAATTATAVGMPVRFDGTVDSPTVVGADVQTRVAVPRVAVGDLQATPRPAHRRRWLIAGVGLLVAAAIAAFLLVPGRLSPAPSRIPMEQAGNSVSLFDGTSIFPWTTFDGEWTVPSGDAVIQGNDGELGRLLPRLSDDADGVSQFFQLQVFIEPQTAESANVQFGFEPVAVSDGTPADEGARYVVELTAQQVTVGECDGSSASPRPLLLPRTMSIAPDEQHVVILERLPTGWFISVDETKIGAVPLRAHELPQFRLGVGPGTARFSDIEIVPLRPRP